jgi:DNA-binding GntR family transcriptional regulator
MDEWLPLSREFHMTAYQAAGMPRLLSVIHALWDTLDRYRRVYYEGEDAVVQSPAIEQAEHQMILEALERGDPTSAAGLIEIHIRRGRLSFVSR